MGKRHSQQSLLYIWPKHSRPDAISDNPASSMSETVSESEVRVNGVDSSIPSRTETSSSATGSTAATSTEIALDTSNLSTLLLILLARACSLYALWMSLASGVCWR